MEFRCNSCGATLAGPPGPGMPFHCNYCGAPQPQVGGAGPPAYGAPPSPYGVPQNPYGGGAPPPPYGAPQNPYGPGPSPYGAAPPPVFQLQQPGLGAGPGRVVGLVAGIAILISVMGAVGAMVAVRSHPGAGVVPGAAAKAGLPTASLANLSLAKTPDAMTKVTGALAPVPAIGDIDMNVDLTGGPYSRISFTWDRDDTSHVKMVYLYADTPSPNRAAILAQLQPIVGRRMDKDGNMNWQGGFFSYGLDTARSMGQSSAGMGKNLHWKEQVDAGWDLLRGVVLGLPVTVTPADKRDWLGVGYSLAAIGAVDPTIDVDHSTAAMTAAFPAVASETMIGLRHTVAVDHPWYGEAELSWPNEKNGTLEDVMVRPPPQSSSAFPNQDAIEACVQGLIGAKPTRTDEDHLKGTHDTTWKPAEGGEVRVYPHMIDVEIASHFAPKKMSRAEYQRIMNGLDACGRGK
jgi:hypothetical protein